MSNSSLGIRIAIGILLCVANSGAQAADYIFMVPVHVSNLMPNVRLSVDCKIEESANVILAFGQSKVPYTDAGYSGTVKVLVQVNDNQVSRAKNWGCQFITGNPLKVTESKSTMSVSGKMP